MPNVIVVHSPNAKLYGVFADDERGQELAARTFTYETDAHRTIIAIEPGTWLTQEQRAAMLAITHAATLTANDAAQIQGLIAAGYVEIVPIPRGVGFAVTPRGNAILDDGPRYGVTP